eukprot:gb/GEZN01002568.1/.p1 GENE.gb/GEZN01002568.1/~~gb/GEZN01002568.1/.p1  ORF type:complete len:650 (-),score=89.23 gb/GEZN01002568.1/:490-2415(-)
MPWDNDLGCYRSDYPDLKVADQTITEMVFARTEEFGDRRAYVDALTGASYSFRQVRDLSFRYAKGLCDSGFKQGDVLLVYSANSIVYPIVVHSVLAMGGVVSTCNPAYTPHELALQLEDSGAIYLACCAEQLPNVEAALSNKTQPPMKLKVRRVLLMDVQDAEKAKQVSEMVGCPPLHSLLLLTSWTSLLADTADYKKPTGVDLRNDAVLLPYSSGTTGMSKGVMLTHSNVVWNVHQFVITDATDSIAGVLPFFHIYGLQLVMNHTLFTGCTCYVWARFKPEPFLRNIQEKSLTLLHLVPPLLILLAKSPLVDQYDLSSIHTIISGAAPLTSEVAKQVVKRLPKLKHLRQGYGMTELSPITHASPSYNKKYGAAGKLLSTTLALIMGEDGQPVTKTGPEGIGELWVKGPQVMKGYRGQPEATSQTIDKDGWLHTGDIAYVDDEGYFFIVDRLKELIKYKGFQVAPAELEGLLLHHPQIADCAVIPVPCEIAGEIPKAFVVLKPGSRLTEEEIKDFIKQDVAHYKRLRGGVEFVEQIPKSASGKILRRILRAQERKKQEKEEQQQLAVKSLPQLYHTIATISFQEEVMKLKIRSGNTSQSLYNAISTRFGLSTQHFVVMDEDGVDVPVDASLPTGEYTMELS